MESRAETFKRRYDEGLKLLNEGKDDAAMAVMYQAAKDAPEGWLGLASELLKDGKHEIAFERFKEVVAITKDARIRAAAMNNMGMILATRGQNEAAFDAFAEAAKLWPAFPDSHCNMGLICKWRGDFAGALRYIDRALKIDPWHEQAQFIRSMTLLLQGDYLRGFEEYECRWRSTSNGLQKVASDWPEWDGTNGSTLFVYGEQGHGDSILMMRYAKELKKRGVHQIWACQKGMEPLMRTVLDINHVVSVGDRLPVFNCHIPTVSLPRLLKTTTDNLDPSPYLKAENPHDYGEGFHVGICWRGSKAQSNDKIRSTSLELWRDVLAVPGVTFHSLQVDASDEGLLYPQLVQHDKPANWMDTANMVAGLNLVISVDTSIVHLSGALGVPCWCALHSRPYFVFPPKFGDKTPWYESVKLYRQTTEYDWKPVFDKIAEDLCRLAKS